MKILKASLEDLEIVTPLFDLYRQFYGQETDINSANEFMSDRIRNNESVIFLAIDEKNNTGMGFVQLYPAFSSVSLKRIWILNDLFIHEDYRRKGIAEELINIIKSFTRQTNAKGLILETHITNSEDRLSKRYRALLLFL
jgi:GNAT superfamily N-acetyltransferase